MNDWYNDPQDEADPPQCPHCQQWDTLVAGDGKFADCLNCGKSFKLPEEPDYSDAEIERSQALIEEVLGPEEVRNLENQRTCPHGNPWGECDACDHEGDVAFDAARERQGR